MKVFFKIFIIFFTFLNFFWVYAQWESEKIENIELYIKKHKKDIRAIIQKYDLKSNQDLQDWISSLDNLLEIIKKVKQSNISEENKEQIRVYLSEEIIKINSILKPVLKQAKKDFDIKIKELKEPYIELSEKISYLLEKISSLISKSKLNKEILSLKESILKENIDRIKVIEKSFREFSNLTFYSEEEIKMYLKKLIEETKKEIFILRNNLKKD